MRIVSIAVLCVVMCGSAWAEDALIVQVPDDPVPLSHDVKVYAPLPDDQLYPVVDDSVTYVPGIEVPRGGTTKKEIIDQVVSDQ